MTCNESLQTGTSCLQNLLPEPSTTDYTPDEIWTKILEMGLQSSSSSSSDNNNNKRLTYKDLCCLSISSRRLHRLSNDPSLWSSLLSLDFPSNFSPSSISHTTSPKSLYQFWYEKDKARRIAAHQRAVLRVESRISEHNRRLQELRVRRAEEEERIKCVVAELNRLHKVRQASVALNVWQPEIIQGRQKQMVEQCAVPVDARINSLDMELKLCRQQILGFEKAYKDEKRRLEEANEQLTLMKYHPLQDPLVTQSRVDGHDTKRKKLKRCKTADDEQKRKS